MTNIAKAALLSLLAVASSLAIAQATAPGAKLPTNAADPDAPVPLQHYRSALGRYQAFADAEVGDWRAANALVLRRGGWREYAREAARPDGSTAPAGSAPARPAGGASAPAAVDGRQQHRH